MNWMGGCHEESRCALGIKRQTRRILATAVRSKVK